MEPSYELFVKDNHLTLFGFYALFIFSVGLSWAIFKLFICVVKEWIHKFIVRLRSKKVS